MRIGGALDRRHFLAGTFLTMTAGLVMPQLPAQEIDLTATRRIAENQHNIVLVLIKKKEFTKAAEEADKIFAMKWPESQETALRKCLLEYSDLFRHDQHPEIALGLLDRHLNMFKSNKNRAEILSDKAYLLEGLGRHDEALDCFGEAKKLLETKGPSDPNKAANNPTTPIKKPPQNR